MATTKKAKKNSVKKRATVSVKRNGKTLYGAVAQNILKKRAAAKRRAAAKVNPKPAAQKRAATTAKAHPTRQAVKKTVSKKRINPKVKRNGLFSGIADKAERAAKWAKTQTFKISALDYERAPKRVFKVKASSGEEALRIAKSQHGTERYGRFKVGNPNLRATTAKRRTRRNPDGELYETFTGQQHTHHDEVTAPTGAPRNLDELGDFVEFKWIDNEGHKYTVNLEKQGIDSKLAGHQYADGRYELALVSAPGAPLPFFGDYLPHGDHGHIYEVTYRAQKLHLGDTKPQLYFHTLGEETGRPPVLHINKDGELIFKGGEYWIEASGIHN